MFVGSTVRSSASRAARASGVLRRCTARRHISIAPLPYQYDALAPALSEETLRFHYDRHHAGYFQKLQMIAEQRPELQSMTNEQIIFTEPEDSPVYMLATQIYNHDFYWRSMSPTGGGMPEGDLAKQIKRDFGSYDQMMDDFNAEAVSLFGSGWVWLVLERMGPVDAETDPDEDEAEQRKILRIIQTREAGSPLRYGLQPILVCDLWEHAYYVDYRNDKVAYMLNFWQITNWEFAEENYHNAKYATFQRGMEPEAPVANPFPAGARLYGGLDEHLTAEATDDDGQLRGHQGGGGGHWGQYAFGRGGTRPIGRPQPNDFPDKFGVAAPGLKSPKWGHFQASQSPFPTHM